MKSMLFLHKGPTIMIKCKGVGGDRGLCLKIWHLVHHLNSWIYS
jgi:hypothetical protein